MEYGYNEVFPDPKAGDLDCLRGKTGEDRLQALRRVALELVEFLKSEEGLGATDREVHPIFRSEFSLPLSVDSGVSFVKTMLPGVSAITVQYAENGEKIQDKFSTESKILGEQMVSPIITVYFHTTVPWNPEAVGLAFYTRIAEIMGARRLVFGHGVAF